jgi:hypothetical protein
MDEKRGPTPGDTPLACSSGVLRHVARPSGLAAMRRPPFLSFSVQLAKLPRPWNTGHLTPYYGERKMMGFPPKVEPSKALGEITSETVNVNPEQPKLEQNRFSPEPITALWKLRHFWIAAKCLGGSRYGSPRTLRRYACRRAPEGNASAGSLFFSWCPQPAIIHNQFVEELS